MSADPIWCLFRVKPSDVPNVRNAFDQAVVQSQISEKLSKFLRKRTEASGKFPPQDKAILNSLIPGFFVDKNQNPDAFDWDDLHEVGHLFFPEAFVDLFSSLFVGDYPLISESNSQAVVITNRVGATQMLWGGLGWERASRLPGYFGNMFVPPEDVANNLTTIEEIFEEVSTEEFLECARAIGARGNCNEDKAESLQSLILSAFRTVLREGNGLLALSHPHVGSL